MIFQLTQDEIESVLRLNTIGRLGFSNGNKTYIVPVNYAYDGKFIIAHSEQGMKIDVMQQYPQVCFEVDEIKNSISWRSVIVWGEYQELHEKRDRYYAIKLFSERLIHAKIKGSKRQEPAVGSSLVSAVIYRIMIAEKSGRFENE